MSNLAVFILQLLSGLLHLFHTYIIADMVQSCHQLLMTLYHYAK